MVKRINAQFAGFEGNSIHQYLLLIAVTLIAAALRFYKLGVWSFWIDEAWSVRDSLALGVSRSILSKFYFLFYLLIKPALVLLGVNEWSARLVPALIGIASVPILYFIIKRIFDSKVAILAATLLALAPWHLYWSQNARFYTLLLLLYNLSLFAFYWGLERDQLRYMIASITILGLAVATHPTAILLVPVVTFYLLLLKVLSFETPPGLRLRNLIPFILLPLIYGLYEVLRSAAGERLIISVIFSEFFVGKPSPLHALRLLVGVVYYIGIPLVCLALFGGIYLLLEKKRIGLLLLSGAFIPLLVLLVPVSQTRYIFLSLPIWVILGTIAIKEIFAQTGKHGSVLAVGVLFLLLADPVGQDWLYYNYQNGHRWDWKGAFALVRERKVDGDLVATTWSELGTYYLGEDVMLMHRLDPDAIMQSGKRIWFVDDGWVNPPLREWLQENSELIDVRDVHIPGKTFGMRVYLYDPANKPPRKNGLANMINH